MPLAAGFFNQKRKQRNIRWGDPADPAGLSERSGADLGKLLSCFSAKSADAGEVEVSGKGFGILRPELFDRGILTGDISGVA